MALTCPSCGDANAQAGIGDSTQCLSCGTRFDSTGAVRDTNPATVLGNLADLQRVGATEAPKSGSPEFVLPPGVTAEDATEGAKLAAERVDEEAAAPDGMRQVDSPNASAKVDTKADTKASAEPQRSYESSKRK